jgi:hypothetical protein
VVIAADNHVPWRLHALGVNFHSQPDSSNSSRCGERGSTDLVDVVARTVDGPQVSDSATMDR